MKWMFIIFAILQRSIICFIENISHARFRYRKFSARLNATWSWHFANNFAWIHQSSFHSGALKYVISQSEISGKICNSSCIEYVLDTLKIVVENQFDVTFKASTYNLVLKNCKKKLFWFYHTFTKFESFTCLIICPCVLKKSFLEFHQLLSYRL